MHFAALCRAVRAVLVALLAGHSAAEGGKGQGPIRLQRWAGRPDIVRATTGFAGVFRAS